MVTATVTSRAGSLKHDEERLGGERWPRELVSVLTSSPVNLLSPFPEKQGRQGILQAWQEGGSQEFGVPIALLLWLSLSGAAYLLWACFAVSSTAMESSPTDVTAAFQAGVLQKKSYTTFKDLLRVPSPAEQCVSCGARSLSHGFDSPALQWLGRIPQPGALGTQR